MKKAVVSQSSVSPSSERKAASNRLNAQRSTGPRSQGGKARSSLNALRHGILARAAFNVTLEGEDRRVEFEDIVQGLAEEFQPQTMSDHLTVQQAAGCYWRLAKVLTFETETAWRNKNGSSFPLDEVPPFFKYEFFETMEIMVNEQAKVFPKAGLGEPTIPNGACSRTVMRYEASITATLFRCLNLLKQRLKERSQLEEGPADGVEETDEAPIPQQAVSEPVESAQSPIGGEENPNDPTPASGSESAASGEIHERSQNDPIDGAISKKAGGPIDEKSKLSDDTGPPKGAISS